MPELIMFVGLSASGKSTKANKLKKKGYIIHSSDELRSELYGDVDNQDNNVELFEELHKRIKYDLLNGNHVVYDATNLSSKRRRTFLDSLKKIECSKECIVFATPFNDCVKRDKKRERRVGSSAIDRMYKSFNMPNKMEGFDYVQIEYSNYDKDNYKVWDKIEYLSTIPQFNKHHTLTIGEHCVLVAESLKGDKISWSGLLHDVGKQYTASFKNSKGEYTNESHYYGHENVSAYESMFYLNKKFFCTEDIVYLCSLIQYHMKLYELTTIKSINKFKKFVGEEFLADLSKLHKADKSAK